MEDTRIIDLYWNRNQQAITETEEKYGRYLRKISWNILYNDEDCKECLNDTLMKAWNSMPTERPDILSAFLAVIIRNLALDRYRRNHSRKRGEGQVDAVYEELAEFIGKESPEQEVMAKELKVAIDRFLQGLDQETRMIFVRRYWYMDSIQEIAKWLEIGEAKVKTTLFRTRKKLQSFLEGEGFEV